MRVRCNTVYVNNIPPRFHWKGRFGFIRFESMADAKRIIERLNGFRSFGFRIGVNLAQIWGESYLLKKST